MGNTCTSSPSGSSSSKNRKTTEAILRFINSSKFETPPTPDDFIFSEIERKKNMQRSKNKIDFNKIISLDESILKPNLQKNDGDEDVTTEKTKVDWTILIAAITTYPIPFVEYCQDTGKDIPSLFSIVSKMLDPVLANQYVDVLLRGNFVSSTEPFSDCLHLLVRSFPDRLDVLKLLLHSIPVERRISDEAFYHHTVYDKILAEEDEEYELRLESPTSGIDTALNPANNTMGILSGQDEINNINFSRANSPSFVGAAAASFEHKKSVETTLLRLAIRTSLASHHFKSGFDLVKLLLDFPPLPVLNHQDINGQTVLHDLCTSRIFMTVKVSSEKVGFDDEDNVLLMSPGSIPSKFPKSRIVLQDGMTFVVKCFRELMERCGEYQQRQQQTSNILHHGGEDDDYHESKTHNNNTDENIISDENKQQLHQVAAESCYNPEFFTKRTKAGFTFLHFAVYHSFPELVKLIVLEQTQIVLSLEETVTENENSSFCKMNALHLACYRVVHHDEDNNNKQHFPSFDNNNSSSDNHQQHQENETEVFARALGCSAEELVCQIVSILLKSISINGAGSDERNNYRKYQLLSSVCGTEEERNNCLSLALKMGNRKLCKILFHREKLDKVPDENSFSEMRKLTDEERNFIGENEDADEDLVLLPASPLFGGNEEQQDEDAGSSIERELEIQQTKVYQDDEDDIEAGNGSPINAEDL